MLPKVNWSFNKKLGLSRESVWKAINALRKAGHDIAARKSQGYRYVSCAHLDDMVIAYHLQHELPLTVEKTVTSTQDVAKKWLATQTELTPAAFVADARPRPGGGTRILVRLNKGTRSEPWTRRGPAADSHPAVL